MKLLNDKSARKFIIICVSIFLSTAQVYAASDGEKSPNTESEVHCIDNKDCNKVSKENTVQSAEDDGVTLFIAMLLALKGTLASPR